jgi:hypothetical protein
MVERLLLRRFNVNQVAILASDLGRRQFVENIDQVTACIKCTVIKLSFFFSESGIFERAIIKGAGRKYGAR